MIKRDDFESLLATGQRIFATIEDESAREKQAAHWAHTEYVRQWKFEPENARDVRIEFCRRMLVRQKPDITEPFLTQEATERIERSIDAENQMEQAQADTSAVAGANRAAYEAVLDALDDDDELGVSTKHAIEIKLRKTLKQ